jgi:hypothetical protein
MTCFRALVSSIAVSALLIQDDPHHYARLAATPGTVVVLTAPDGGGLPVPGPSDFHDPTAGIPIHDGSIVWVGKDGMAGWRLRTDDYRVLFMLPPSKPAQPVRVVMPWLSVSEAERVRRIEAGEEGQ